MTLIELESQAGIPLAAIKLEPILHTSAIKYLQFLHNDFFHKVGKIPKRVEVSDHVFHLYESELLPSQTFSTKGDFGGASFGLFFKSSEVKLKKYLKGWEARLYA